MGTVKLPTHLHTDGAIRDSGSQTCKPPTLLGIPLIKGSADVPGMLLKVLWEGDAKLKIGSKWNVIGRNPEAPVMQFTRYVNV